MHKAHLTKHQAGIQTQPSVIWVALKTRWPNLRHVYWDNFWYQTCKIFDFRHFTWITYAPIWMKDTEVKMREI